MDTRASFRTSLSVLDSSDRMPKATPFQIWVESVCDDSSDDDETYSGSITHRQSSSRQLPPRFMSLGSSEISSDGSSLSPVSTRQNSLQLVSRENSVDETRDETLTRAMISDWLQKVQLHGIDQGKEGKELEYERSKENLDSILIQDPYVSIKPDEIGMVDGTVEDGLPVGLCTVKLKNGDFLVGVFRDGQRQGRGGLEISASPDQKVQSIKGYYRNGILSGEGRAEVAAGFWQNTLQPITLYGNFCNGFMHGAVRGTNEKGDLAFVGAFKNGTPSGSCWLAREGQGWLYGTVDERGRFSGNDVMFIYPDLTTCLLGEFQDETMVMAFATKVIDASLNNEGIMVLQTSPQKPDSLVYSYSPSDSINVLCDWNLSDPYESTTVFCKASLVDSAGDGLFALRDLQPETVISYYNGLKIAPGDKYAANSISYQIYVDWNDTDNSPFVDVPSECVDISSYKASLGHKANHSFNPNAKFVAVHHPRFGRIPALQTVRPVKQGEEIFSDYKYDIALAPGWYQVAWHRFNNPSSSRSSGSDTSDTETLNTKD